MLYVARERNVRAWFSHSYLLLYSRSEGSATRGRIGARAPGLRACLRPCGPGRDPDTPGDHNVIPGLVRNLGRGEKMQSGGSLDPENHRH
eukprot:COSAG02_NODE_3352_length_6884_cov_9.048342_1_plen_90_part_00